MVNILISLIAAFSQVLQIAIIIKIILSYFMDPYNPIRSALDRLIEPMLNPIRRVVPLIGMFDFSAFILIILVQLMERLLIALLLKL
jgi:YggT family protein